MSLIEEALRQIEANQPQSVATKRAPAATAPPSPPVAEAPAKAVAVPVTGPQPEIDGEPRGLAPWVGILAALGGSALLVLVGLTLGALWTSRASRSTAAPTVTPISAPTEPATVAASVPPIQRARTRPRRTPAAVMKLPELRLSGTVEGVGEPMAIVNGNVLRLGESIDGAVLVEVRGDTARFRWRDEEFSVKTVP